jgi:hypothetical protein
MTENNDTTTLIEKLAATGPQKPARWPWLLFVPAFALAWWVNQAIYGLRPDLAEAWRQFSFLFRLAAGVGLTIAGSLLLRRCWQPGATAPRSFNHLIPALLGLSLLGGIHGVTTNSLFSEGWMCMLALVSLALPFAFVLALVSRNQAPTNLPFAATAIALAASGPALLIFTLHCAYTGMGFILFWYGLALAGVLALARTVLVPALRW